MHARLSGSGESPGVVFLWSFLLLPLLLFLIPAVTAAFCLTGGDETVGTVCALLAVAVCLLVEMVLPRLAPVAKVKGRAVTWSSPRGRRDTRPLSFFLSLATVALLGLTWRFMDRIAALAV